MDWLSLNLIPVIGSYGGPGAGGARSTIQYNHPPKQSSRQSTSAKVKPLSFSQLWKKKWLQYWKQCTLDKLKPQICGKLHSEVIIIVPKHVDSNAESACVNETLFADCLENSLGNYSQFKCRLNFGVVLTFWMVGQFRFTCWKCNFEFFVTTNVVIIKGYFHLSWEKKGTFSFCISKG